MHTSHCGILLRDGDQPAAVGCNVAESVRGRLAIRDDFAVDAMPAGCRRSVGSYWRCTSALPSTRSLPRWPT